jgi:hypothetical protein
MLRKMGTPGSSSSSLRATAALMARPTSGMRPWRPASDSMAPALANPAQTERTSASQPTTLRVDHWTMG